jgi:nitric oxide reductase NorD protein
MRPSRLLRNRLLGATRRLVAPATRWREARQPPVTRLVDVQRRLELLLAAMFGQSMRVVSRARTATPAATDVVLPAQLPGTTDAVEAYRMLALQQGARIVRGTRLLAPDEPLARDLYLLLEAAAVDAEIMERAPGLERALRRMRAEALAARPGIGRLVPQQREVELRLRALLSAEPGAGIPELPPSGTATESAETAASLAARLRAAGSTRVQYRALPAVALWDDETASAAAKVVDLAIPVDSITIPVQVEGDDEQSDTGTESDRWEEGGDERDASTADVAPGGAAPDEGADTAAMEGEGEDEESSRRAAEGIAYPEWIERHGRLEPRHTTVRPVVAAERTDDWARSALREHGPLVRQVRDRFALLRARRMRLRAQRSGDELDLDACVEALIDAQIGRVPGDRLYQTTRVTRHTLSLAILVDVSGSTNTRLPDGRTVLDVERLSLLLASEALDALGDPYAMFSFSGLGRHEVRVATVKGFAEHDSAAVHRRISSLEAADNTRLGAAVRHATAVLAAQPSGRRVLLVISDGRPNDVDRYQGSDAIEDSRQALLAARARGTHTFCLTVDTEEAEYLPRLFGEGGYRVISEPAQLPGALIQLVDRLLRG